MRALGLALGWALVVVIIWLSVTPRPVEVPVEQGDKLGHLAAYGAMMFWFCLLYARSRTRAAYAAGFIAMGVALEFVQRALGYRSFEIADMVADAAGVLLGWGLALAVAPLVRRR
jgi:VanZ family protein